jgi:hypothetical protein
MIKMTDPTKERLISELLSSATQASTLAKAIKDQAAKTFESDIYPDNFVLSLHFSVLNEAIRSMNFAHGQLLDYSN